MAAQRSLTRSMSGSTPTLPPAATSSTAAPGSVDSAAASTPNVPTAVGGAAQLLAARRLRELLAEMKMLMPQLPPASLRSAIQELEQHLGASAGRCVDRAAVSSPVAQPAFGLMEEEEEPPPADADAERGDAASVGSLDEDARESGEGEEEEEQDGAAGAPSAGREERRNDVQLLNRAALLLGLIGTDPVGAAVTMVPVCATAGSPDPTARLTARALSGAG